MSQGGGGCSEIVFLAGFRKSAPGLLGQISLTCVVGEMLLVAINLISTWLVEVLYNDLPKESLHFFA